MNNMSQYPSYYSSGAVQNTFAQQPGQTGQAGTYRHFSENGNLQELQLKSRDGHVWLDRQFGQDGSQTNSVIYPNGKPVTVAYPAPNHSPDADSGS